MSGGGFHAGADALGDAWQAAARHGRLPDTATLNALVNALQAEPWTLHGDGPATLHATYPLGLNALAKGYIVDRAAETAHALPDVRQVLVNAGGDLRTLGPRDDAPPVARCRSLTARWPAAAAPTGA